MTPRNGRVVLLSNPTAGHGNAALQAARAVARLHQLGLEVEHIAGVDRGHAHELAVAAVASRPEAFVVVGGDGGVSVAVQALAGTDVPLGIIPTGIANDVARTARLPLDDVERAADIAAVGRTRTIDLGHVRLDDGSERYFVSVLGADHATDVLELSHRLPVRRPGRAQFVTASLLSAHRVRARHLTVLTDDGRDLSGDFYVAAIGNTRAYAAGMAMCPGAVADDGMLDLTLIRRARPAVPRLVRHLVQGYSGGVVPDEALTFHRARAVRLEAEGQMLVADGEFIGPAPATVTCVPKALRLIVA